MMLDRRTFLNDNEEIILFLKKHNIINYSIRSNGIVDVSGDVNIIKSDIKRIPIKFGIVTGTFKWTYGKIESLYGVPDKCYSFKCEENINLKTLEGAPKTCAFFNCDMCKNLESLKGAPIKCDSFSCIGCIKIKNLNHSPKCNELYCSYCENLESLEGAPKKCKNFSCIGCINLKTLKYSPKKCKVFSCSECLSIQTLHGAPIKNLFFNTGYCKNLKSLEGAPKKCEKFYCYGCDNLKSLEGAPEKCEEFDCSFCGNLNYDLTWFPKCEYLFVTGTVFEKLRKKITSNFLDLVNAKTELDFKAILVDKYISGVLDFDNDIFPLLKDKTMTEEAFKYKYRGIVAGEKYIF